MATFRLRKGELATAIFCTGAGLLAVGFFLHWVLFSSDRPDTTGEWGMSIFSLLLFGGVTAGCLWDLLFVQRGRAIRVDSQGLEITEGGRQKRLSWRQMTAVTVTGFSGSSITIHGTRKTEISAGSFENGKTLRDEIIAHAEPLGLLDLDRQPDFLQPVPSTAVKWLVFSLVLAMSLGIVLLDPAAIWIGGLFTAFAALIFIPQPTFHIRGKEVIKQSIRRRTVIHLDKPFMLLLDPPTLRLKQDSERVDIPMASKGAYNVYHWLNKEIEAKTIAKPAHDKATAKSEYLKLAAVIHVCSLILVLLYGRLTWGVLRSCAELLQTRRDPVRTEAVIVSHADRWADYKFTVDGQTYTASDVPNRRFKEGDTEPVIYLATDPNISHFVNSRRWQSAGALMALNLIPLGVLLWFVYRSLKGRRKLLGLDGPAKGPEASS